jgi:cytosine/uracil/thiamine/allantoin permease
VPTLEADTMTRKHHEALFVMLYLLLFPTLSFALGGTDEKTSTAMLVGFFLFSTLGSFAFVTSEKGVREGALCAAVMLLVWCILFVVFGIMKGGIRIKMTGIPLDLAIGVVASLIAAIIMLIIQRK